jgi:acyl-CoA reductase-like NAD-dependent aldehyde dehydrogenase
MQPSSRAPTPIAEGLLIGGRRVDAPQTLEVRNPARPTEVVGTIVRGTPAHVEQAVAAAKAAQPAWAAATVTQRAEALERALARLEEDVDQRAAVFVRENGKPFAQAKGELQAVPRRQRTALTFAAQLDAERRLQAPNGKSLVLGRPYGVVVSIVPWNSPDVLAFTQFVAALLAGNGVVLKPPETCPLTLIESVRRFSRELPPGIINVVTGLPGEIGDALTTHADVGKIGFTGSIPSATHIMANAAKSIKGVTLELGGNDPAILLDDVQINDAMLARMVTGTFMMSGQICMAIKRVYVQRSRSEEFLERFSRAVDALVVGDGLEPSVTMGPVHSQVGLVRARGFLDDAEKRGANVRPLGKVLDAATFDHGYFLQPTLVTDIPDDASLMREEQFCPALPVTTFDTVEEVLERSNRTHFGLGASVWSRDVDRAIEVARGIESGQVWVNNHGILAINHLAPYGGVKQSGIGRKSGLEGILEYLQSQTITTYEHAS